MLRISSQKDEQTLLGEEVLGCYGYIPKRTEQLPSIELSSIVHLKLNVCVVDSMNYFEKQTKVPTFL